MRQCVVVEKLHRHGCRQLLRRLEQSHQQNRPQKVINHAVTDAELLEQRQRTNRVVLAIYRITAIEIEDCVEQARDAESILNG